MADPHFGNCRNCEAWEPWGEDLKGRCLRRPPTAGIRDDVKWPIVDRFDGCFDHIHKTEDRHV